VFAWIAASAAFAAPPSFDTAPWLEDLTQIRTAIDERYPNRDWMTTEREVSLDRWFERTADAIRKSRSEFEARRALERLIERFNDGHVSLRWPQAPQAEGVAATGKAAQGFADVEGFCASQGYDGGRVSAGVAAGLPGYRPAGGPALFRTGTVNAAGRTIGVVRIGLFAPEGYPDACKEAVARASIAIEKPCDDACADRLLTEAFAIMTRSMMASVETLQAAGAQVLLVDLTRNGGGSDWAEAAARIVSAAPLESAQIKVMRSDAMSARWKELADRLKAEASRQSGQTGARLSTYAERANRIALDLRPCAETSCSRLVSAGYTTGLLRSAPEGVTRDSKWAVHIFNPAQFPFRPSVWKGPLIVLVDDETWSAAEQFAALLQDNQAAIVLGARTGGAGCGHLYGSDPVTLRNSGATLEMPNCVRLRRNGRNEVSGIVPDVPTGVRWNDGPKYAGELTAARLPEAIGRAEAQARQRVPDMRRMPP
jgi:hypothetical protein